MNKAVRIVASRRCSSLVLLELHEHASLCVVYQQQKILHQQIGYYMILTIIIEIRCLMPMNKPITEI